MRICPFPWCLLTALVQVLVRTCLHDAGALHRPPCSQVHPPLGMIHMVTKLILKHYSHQVISLPKAPCWLPRVSSFFHYLVFVSISGFSLTLAIPYTSTSLSEWLNHLPKVTQLVSCGVKIQTKVGLTPPHCAFSFVNYSEVKRLIRPRFSSWRTCNKVQRVLL